METTLPLREPRLIDRFINNGSTPSPTSVLMQQHSRTSLVPVRLANGRSRMFRTLTPLPPLPAPMPLRFESIYCARQSILKVWRACKSGGRSVAGGNDSAHQAARPHHARPAQLQSSLLLRGVGLDWIAWDEGAWARSIKHLEGVCPPFAEEWLKAEASERLSTRPRPMGGGSV